MLPIAERLFYFIIIIFLLLCVALPGRNITASENSQDLAGSVLPGEDGIQKGIPEVLCKTIQDQVAHILHCRTVPKGESHVCYKFAIAGCRVQHASFVEIMAEGLFAQDVEIADHTGHGWLKMHSPGCDDVDDVQIGLFQHCLQINVVICDPEFLCYCIIRAMPTIDSDGCRPPIPGHADHLFRRMASSFPWTPESVVVLLRNQWTACSGI